MGGRVITFPELCHGCGGCWLVCPERAISAGTREIGVIEQGTASGLEVTLGRLRVGEPLAVPLIKKIKSVQSDSDLEIIDSPPGTSCPVVTSIKDNDFVVLVTEPTPFGLHDLTLAVETVRQIDCPFGVVVNRAGSGDDRVHEYCRGAGIPILLEIPDDRRIARAYSDGIMAVTAVPETRELFHRLYLDVCSRCAGGVA
jgi:MinD superfamily P-loop ATPase